MPNADLHTIRAEGAEAVLDLRGGHVRRFAVAGDGRTIEPTHSAPWVEDPVIQADEEILPNLRYLSGDFFCAPFSTADIDGAPEVVIPGKTGELVALTDLAGFAEACAHGGGRAWARHVRRAIIDVPMLGKVPGGVKQTLCFLHEVSQRTAVWSNVGEQPDGRQSGGAS